MKRILKIFLLAIIIFSCLYAQEEKECKKEQELLVLDIIPGGAAEKVGIKAQDIIAKYNGKEVHCLDKLNMLKKGVEADSIEIVIKRGDDLISFMIPKGQIGVYLKEVLPEIKFEKDAVVIDGINPLGWDTGESSSFMGALTRVTEYLKIKKNYTYIMGTSGSVFRIHFHENWCPSSPDAMCGFNCGVVGAQSINLDVEPMHYIEMADNKNEMVQKIMESIDRGMPVIAIDLIEVPEWGLIVGYQKSGDELIVRTYYDRRENYDIAEKFPWAIMLLSKVDGKIDDKNNFKNSFKIAQELYETEKYDAYYSGIAAIEYWIKRLKEDDFESLDDQKFEDVMLSNAWVFERFAHDRKLGSEYLKSFADQFPGVEDKIDKLAKIYEEEVELMTEQGTVAPYPFQMSARDDWTEETKQKEIDILSKVLEKEKEANLLIKEINDKINQ